MKITIDLNKLTTMFQKLIDKFLEELKVYAEKWYNDEYVPVWFSGNIVEWVDSVDKLVISDIQVFNQNDGNIYYIMVDAILDSVMRFDIDEILHHISYLIEKRLFGVRSGNNVQIYSDNIELKNKDPQW